MKLLFFFVETIFYNPINNQLIVIDKVNWEIKKLLLYGLNY